MSSLLAVVARLPSRAAPQTIKTTKTPTTSKTRERTSYSQDLKTNAEHHPCAP